MELQARKAALIWLCLANDVMYHVMDLSSPTEIWKKMESRNMSVCSDKDLLSVSSCQPSYSHILNTRCSFYMTSNKNWFDSYTSGDFGLVYMGNNKTSAIAGKGRSRFRCMMVLFGLYMMSYMFQN